MNSTSIWFVDSLIASMFFFLNLLKAHTPSIVQIFHIPEPKNELNMEKNTSSICIDQWKKEIVFILSP